MIPSQPGLATKFDNLPIYIRSNGLHTDICLPHNATTLDWDKILNLSSFQMNKNEIQYLCFGWGDKGFYLDTPNWSDLKISTALNAGFVPSPAAIHIQVLKDAPLLDSLTKLTYISEIQLREMEAYILDYLPQSEGQAVLMYCCRYPNIDDNFYEAKGAYSIFRTCNTWANQVLKKGCIKTAIWVAFDISILQYF